MTKPSIALIRKWYAKCAKCPHRPKCRPLSNCDKAVPQNDYLSLFELGGSGGNDPDNRAVSFVQLNDTFEPDHESTMTDRYLMESEGSFGSASLADHPTAVAWRGFSQAVQELPGNYPHRKALALLAECGFMSKAARKAGISIGRMSAALAKFCAAHGIDQHRLLLRNMPVGK